MEAAFVKDKNIVFSGFCGELIKKGKNANPFLRYYVYPEKRHSHEKVPLDSHDLACLSFNSRFGLFKR